MRYENIIKRINDFFDVDTYGEKAKIYVEHCIRDFDLWKKTFPQDCDTLNLHRAILSTISVFGL